MNINLKNEHLNIMIDSLKVWIQHYEERGFGPEHVITAASMIMSMNKVADTILDNAQNEPESDEEKHPEFVRGPNKDERFVYGKGYEKNKID